jgi:hypothetical protein
VISPYEWIGIRRNESGRHPRNALAISQRGAYDWVVVAYGHEKGERNARKFRVLAKRATLSIVPVRGNRGVQGNSRRVIPLSPRFSVPRPQTSFRSGQILVPRIIAAAGIAFICSAHCGAQLVSDRRHDH